MGIIKEVAWDTKYETGCKEIDNEHKRLFALVNQIAGCKDDKDMIMQECKELVEYTKKHFKHEEEYMESINFDLLEDHRKIHKNIMNELNEFLMHINNLSVEKIADRLDFFVKEFFIDHILTEDIKFVGYKAE